jgi:SAM-dependent methyltransferase
MMRKLFDKLIRRRQPGSAKTANSFISEKLLAHETWSFAQLSQYRSEFLETDIGALWKDIPNGHKWLNYLPIYQECLSCLVGKEPRVLEIGVDKGASLLLWKRYFGPGAKIVGIDVLAECVKYDNPRNAIFVRIGSQADPKFLAAITAEFGPFDLVIDDGSHVASHQIAAFNSLFDEGLATDGIYLIEDVETAYWGKRTGHLDVEISIVDFAKEIVNLMHYPFTTNDYGFFLLQNLSDTTLLTVPRITKLVDQIRFFTSIIVFYKSRRVPPIVEHLR